MSRLRCIWSSIIAYWQRIAKEDSSFFLLLLFFHLTVIGQIYTSLHQPTLWQNIKCVLHIVPAAFECFLLTFICHILPLRVRRGVQGIVLFCFGVLFIADTFLILAFNTYFNMEKMDIVMGAEPQTIAEFFTTYILVPRTMLVILLGIAFFVGLCWFLRKYASKFCQHWANGMVVLLLFSVMAFCVTFAKGCYVSARGAVAGKLEFVPTLMGNLGDRCYLHSQIVRVVKDAYGFVQFSKSSAEALEILEANRQPILHNGSSIPYVVLVLGESTDRNKMSLYGYHLDTTPHLCQRMAQGELMRFDDTISGAVYTAEAMRQIFSFAEKGDTQRWYEHGCLLDIMHDAGYHTAWLSNQFPVDRNGNMDEVLSRRADEVAFVAGPGGLNDKNSYDEHLLPLLDTSLAQNTAAKQFYVVHLIGAHNQYNLRYPQSAVKFAADDEQAETAYRRQLKADYDNAIAYNDKIMEEIFQRFTDKDAIVIYLSDHGEEVCEGSDFAGHSMENSANRHMVEIPMMVWTSPCFRENHPDLVTRIAGSTQQPFRSDDLIHAILDLVDIAVADYDPQKSLWNPAYMPKERIFGGAVYQR